MVHHSKFRSLRYLFGIQEHLELQPINFKEGDGEISVAVLKLLHKNCI